jgi:hypothetical protein
MRDRQTDRQREDERQTDRQTDRQREDERQTDRQRERQRLTQIDVVVETISG